MYSIVAEESSRVSPRRILALIYGLATLQRCPHPTVIQHGGRPQGARGCSGNEAVDRGYCATAEGELEVSHVSLRGVIRQRVHSCSHLTADNCPRTLVTPEKQYAELEKTLKDLRWLPLRKWRWMSFLTTRLHVSAVEKEQAPKELLRRWRRRRGGTHRKRPAGAGQQVRPRHTETDN